MKRMMRLFISLSLLYSLIIAGNADLIIFSYNRPLQLYALLESVAQHVTRLDEVMVIYRASDAQYEDAYQKVRATFTNVYYCCQENAPDDFKQYTLDCISRTTNPYIIFAVDDIVVKDHIDLGECIECIEQYNAYGFYLRLGKHLNYCYATFSDQALPHFIIDQNGICVWDFAGAEWDWGYPHSLDMTLYRKIDLMPLLDQLDYHSPNQLEHYLAINADYSKKGVCFEASKVINLPINLVQTYTGSNCVNTYSTPQLLDLFNNGMKMDVNALYQVNNRSSHMFDAQIQFILRS